MAGQPPSHGRGEKWPARTAGGNSHQAPSASAASLTAATSATKAQHNEADDLGLQHPLIRQCAGGRLCERADSGADDRNDDDDRKQDCDESPDDNHFLPPSDQPNSMTAEIAVMVSGGTDMPHAQAGGPLQATKQFRGPASVPSVMVPVATSCGSMVRRNVSRCSSCPATASWASRNWRSVNSSPSSRSGSGLSP